MGISVGLLAAIGFAALCTVPWRRKTEALVVTAIGTHWQTLQEAHQSATENLASWPEDERNRAVQAQKLLAGDAEALEDEVSSVLEELDFPFEAQCRVATPSPTEAFILVDLPEIVEKLQPPRNRLDLRDNSELKRIEHPPRGSRT